MISILGAVFLLLVGAALLVRREWLPWILSAAVPFSATAGLTVAGQSIVIYHVVAIVVVILALRSHGLAGVLRANIDVHPGLRPLLAFGIWALAITALAPTAFAGIKVLNPRVGIDDGVKTPAALAPSISNLAQSGYLVIGIATVIALASTRYVSFRMPAAGFAVGTALSSFHSALPQSVRKLLFDNSANVSYTTGEFDGVERMRGVFSEPAALGAFSVTATVFFVMSASTVRGSLRVIFLGLAAWALLNTVLSFSGGALLSGLIVLTLVAAWRLLSYFRSRLLVSPAGLTAALVVVVVIVLTGPVIKELISAVFDDKAGSTSYENRSAADAFSYSVTGETLGLGAGVGSNRPSSFFASLLSTTGLLGVALLTTALILIAIGAVRRREFAPAVAALLAIVISKVISGPDLSDPALWFLVAVCAHGAWKVDPVTTAQRSRLSSPVDMGGDPRPHLGEH